MSRFDNFKALYSMAFGDYESEVNAAAEREAERTAPEKLQRLNENAKLHEVNEAHSEFLAAKSAAKEKALEELNKVLDMLRDSLAPLFTDAIKPANRERLESWRMRGSLDKATIAAAVDAMRGDVPALLALKSMVEGMHDADPATPPVAGKLADLPALDALEEYIGKERERLEFRLETLQSAIDPAGRVRITSIPHRWVGNFQLSRALDALEELGC